MDHEIKRRRTFGIISHPDAGKTTLTEKLLLFGGAIQLAGSVKARKASTHAVSDWMAIEKERGISVTSSVMQFDYRDYVVNLLDTPGHQDFSEDTYRVLTAVDSALMVIDHSKGVETQTEKLMEVCRMRNTPVITFINKLDREGREPLELLAEIEDKLQIECVPLSWPIGMGKEFKGVYNIYRGELHLFSPGKESRPADTVVIKGVDDPRLDQFLGSAADRLREDLELLAGASDPFDYQQFLKAGQTPVFFGSAINNFGVRELLDAFVELAPAPGCREATPRPICPEEEEFSGFTFKIQANMNPAHRDRIAFFRVCSGRFRRGMKVWHQRLGKEVALANATIFMAQDRSNVEEAFPGDIIGIHNHGTIKIGDAFTTSREEISFTGIPNFAPEHFRRVILRNPLKAKQLAKGLLQLAEEGAVQVFRPQEGNDYILGAVGVLQFEVTVARLQAEYGVDAIYEPVGFGAARWIVCDDRRKLDEFKAKNRANLAMDAENRLTYLAESAWMLSRTIELYPDINFLKTREHG